MSAKSMQQSSSSMQQQQHNHKQLGPPQSSQSSHASEVATPSSTMRLRLRRQAEQDGQAGNSSGSTGGSSGNSNFNYNNLSSGFGFGLVLADRGCPPVLQIDGLAGGECEAAQSGLVRPGDIILRINNVDVSRCTFDEALQTLASTPVGSYASFIVRAPFGFTTRLVTTFEEDGTPKTLRITERANSNSNNFSNRRLSSTTLLATGLQQFNSNQSNNSHQQRNMVNAEAQSSTGLGGSSCANCQHKVTPSLSNGNSLTTMTPSTARRG